MTSINESQNIVSELTPWKEISDPAILATIPIVSVHMATYNHAPYIAQAIEGVLQQKTSFPIELIIGEDCSTDRTREIVLDFQKKHPNIIRVIISERNVGPKINSERVSKACRGKYVASCEGDDYWHDTKKLNMQIEYLESNPDVGLIHSDVDRFYVKQNVKVASFHKERRFLCKYNSVLYGMIVNEYIVETCTAVYRNDMIKKIHQECQYEFSDKFMMEDVQTWTEIAYRSKVKYIDESYATRNILEESTSYSKNIIKTIDFVKNCKKIHLHYANKYGGDESCNMKKIIASRYLSHLSPLAYEARNPELGKEIIEESRKYGVSLGLINYLYSVSAQNNLSSHIIRFCITSMLRCRLLLAKIKLLLALGDRIRQRIN